MLILSVFITDKETGCGVETTPNTIPKKKLITILDRNESTIPLPVRATTLEDQSIKQLRWKESVIFLNNKINKTLQKIIRGAYQKTINDLTCTSV